MVFMEVLIHMLVGSLDGGLRPPEGPAHHTGHSGHQLAMIDCMLRPFRPRSTLDQDIICNFAHPIFWLAMFLIENTFKSKGHHLYVTENINISKVGSQALKCSIKVNDLQKWKIISPKGLISLTSLHVTCRHGWDWLFGYFFNTLSMGADISCRIGL